MLIKHLLKKEEYLKEGWDITFYSTFGEWIVGYRGTLLAYVQRDNLHLLQSPPNMGKQLELLLGRYSPVHDGYRYIFPQTGERYIPLSMIKRSRWV